MVLKPEELERTVKELKELKIMAEELAKQIAAMEEIIKAEMTERGVERLTAGPFRVLWPEVCAMRFDTRAFREQHDDLYAQYLRKHVSRRFSIT